MIHDIQRMLQRLIHLTSEALVRFSARDDRPLFRDPRFRKKVSEGLNEDGAFLGRSL
jgi:hypothetical protein